MLYLHQSLLLWVIGAVILGLIVGWISCRRQPRLEGLGWVWWAIIAFLIGLVLLVLMTFSGRTALWFETAMMYVFWYFFGCCVGCALRNFLNPLPLTAAAASAGVKLTTFPDAKTSAPAATAPVAVAAMPKATGLAAVRPYQWQAAKDAASVTLTGYVPSDEARGRVIAAARTALAPAAVVDKLQLGSGAPSGLESMTSSAFGHLSKLDKGIASLIDTKYTLTGVAGTQPNYDAVMGTVKQLPMGYSLAKVDIVAPPAPPKAVAVKPVAKKPAPAPVAVKAAPPKAPEPKAAPKIAGEDKVPGKRPAGFAAPRGGKADDLKRIRGIGKQNEGRLHGLGIWHFDQVSSWNAQESLWVGSYLAFPGRIEREEWIKQAKVLAAGKETEFSKRVAKGKVATSRDDGTLGNKNVEVVKPMRAVAGKAPANSPAKPPAKAPAKATNPKK
jgi:predicted flap endonuclease-1-like 5' DNA nuclease